MYILVCVLNYCWLLSIVAIALIVIWNPPPVDGSKMQEENKKEKQLAKGTLFFFFPAHSLEYTFIYIQFWIMQSCGLNIKGLI